MQSAGLASESFSVARDGRERDDTNTARARATFPCQSNRPIFTLAATFVTNQRRGTLDIYFAGIEAKSCGMFHVEHLGKQTRSF